jgi:fatty acid desaturase
VSPSFTKGDEKAYIVGQIHIERSEDLRALKAAAIIRRLFGLILAVAGIGLVAGTLPGFVWMLLLGAALIWVGWVVFRQRHIY